MSRSASSFKQGDITKAVKGLVKAGMKVGRVEISGGKIVVFAGQPETSDDKAISGATANENEWDSVQ